MNIVMKNTWGVVNKFNKDATNTSNGNSLSRPSICFYNSNREFISGTNYNGSSTINFTTTANIAYCRLSYANNLSGAVMLNEGSTALPYHPYYEWVED